MRSGGAPPDIDQVSARARTVGAAISQAGAAVLLAVRDDRSVSTWLAAREGPSAGTVADEMAAAVRARHERVESLPDLAGARSVGWLVARPADMASHESQSGGDPSEVAALLSRVLRPGAWVAVALRPQIKRERRATRRWFMARLGNSSTHYSTESEALVASIYAGAGARDEVRSVLTALAAALPGFEIEIEVRTDGRTLTAPGLALAGVGTWAGLGIETDHWRIASAAGATLGAAPLVAASGVLPSGAKSLRRSLERSGVPPSPRKRFIPVRPPRSERSLPNGGRKPAHPGDYPLVRNAFVVGPAMVVGVVSPHAGTSSDVASSRTRRAPVALLDDIGPLVGHSTDGDQPVHISAADAYAGVAALGVAGTGKTQLVQHIWAWNALERVAPSGKPGRPGRANALVAIESKGEGAAGYANWSRSIGDEVTLIEIAEPSSPVIDLIAIPGTASERAAFFTDAMSYAFGEGAIQDRAHEALTAVLSAALAAPEGIGAQAGLEGEPTPIDLAHVLLGGAGDETGVRLAAALAAAHAALPEGAERAELTDALRRLAPFYGSSATASTRRTLTESSRNKIAQLVAAGSWWGRSRPRLTWAEVLSGHRAVVINTGVTSTGRVVPEKLTNVMSAICAYALRDAIMRTCSGWQAAGESVTIFADELSLLAGSSPEVVAWLRNQGRSYGVRNIFAAQYPEQLSGPVKTALYGFGTMLWMRQAAPTVAAEAVGYLTMDGSEWTSADLNGLEPYHAIVRATVGGKTQPAVPIRVAHWADDAARFAADQGYRLPEIPAAPPEPPAILPAADADGGWWGAPEDTNAEPVEMPVGTVPVAADNEWGDLPEIADGSEWGDDLTDGGNESGDWWL